MRSLLSLYIIKSVTLVTPSSNLVEKTSGTKSRNNSTAKNRAFKCAGLFKVLKVIENGISLV